MRGIFGKKLFWAILILLVVILGGLYLYFFTGTVNYLRVTVENLFAKKVTPEEYLAEQDQKDWDYTTQIATGNIMDYNPEEKTILLSFVRPPKLVEKLGGLDNSTKTVKISCSNEQSSYYVTKIKASDTSGASNETQLMESNTDLFGIMRVGDAFFGFCADEFCDEISQTCELHQTIIEE